MANTYRPRRQSARWLDGDCPKEVLAIYDNGGTGKKNGSIDRYTIFYVPPKGEPVEWVSYFASSEFPFSPRGFGQHGELTRSQAAGFRYREAHKAARWSDLPVDVQRAVRDDCRGLAALRLI